jgi:hypothetical protein
MPFVSEKQRRWMWANKPKMAKEWQSVTPTNASLPEKVSEGKVKKSEFPISAGPEDWDALHNTPGKDHGNLPSRDKSDIRKEKIGDMDSIDDFLGGDGTRLVPLLRSIHKLGTLIPLNKVAQGDFEYADLGTNAGEPVSSSPTAWKYPGKLIKRSAGLDQEKYLEDQEPGTDPPAAFPQPKDKNKLAYSLEKLKDLVDQKGKIEKISQISYTSFLDELNKVASSIEPHTIKMKQKEFWKFVRKSAPAAGALLGVGYGIVKGRKKPSEIIDKAISGIGTGTLVGSIPDLLLGAGEAWKKYKEKAI